MHILFISNGYPTDYHPLDGIFYKDQAEALAANGCKVGLIATNPISVFAILKRRKFNLGPSYFEEKKVITSLYKYINIPKHPRYCVKQAKNIGKTLVDDYIQKNGKPDLIHVHCYESILLAMYIKNKYNIPFIITEHSSRFTNKQIPKTMEKFAVMAFSHSAFNIAVSEHFSLFLKEKYGRPFHYVPNIVDTDFYKPNDRVLPKEEFTIISAGALDENKNQQLLLQAFKLLFSSGRKAKLLIAGDGHKLQDLVNLSKELAIENEVSFLGLVSREKLKDYFNTSSIFVLPSKSETFGVVLIEAMSCGLPVISTKSGGPSSIIVSNRLGLLCEIDKQSLFLAMQEVYDNFTSYVSEDIRQEVLKNFSQNAISKKLISIYNNILNKNG